MYNWQAGTDGTCPGSAEAVLKAIQSRSAEMGVKAVSSMFCSLTPPSQWTSSPRSACQAALLLLTPACSDTLPTTILGDVGARNCQPGNITYFYPCSYLCLFPLFLLSSLKAADIPEFSMDSFTHCPKELN